MMYSLYLFFFCCIAMSFEIAKLEWNSFYVFLICWCVVISGGGGGGGFNAVDPRQMTMEHRR